MNEVEAEQVIGALESGRRFEFSNYHAGVREVLEYDVAEGCFVFTTHFAYESGGDARSLFTGEELAEHLRQNFSYESFDLPPMEGPPSSGRGRGLSIDKRSDSPGISGEPFYWIELSYRGVTYKGNDLGELLQNLKSIHAAVQEGRPFHKIRTSAGSPAAVRESLPIPPGANPGEKLASLEKMIAALERKLREEARASPQPSKTAAAQAHTKVV